MADSGLHRHPRPPLRAGAEKSDRTGVRTSRLSAVAEAASARSIHAGVNGLGLPVKLVLTPGQAANVTQAPKLIEDVPFEVVIGDRGFDSQALVDAIEAKGGEAVIPTRKNCKVQRTIRWGPLQGSESGGTVLGQGEAVPTDSDSVPEDRS